MSFLRESNIFMFCVFVVFMTAMALLFLRIRKIQPYYDLKTKLFLSKALVRAAILILLLIAWMGPHLNEKNETQNLSIETKDILFVLDLSHSMLASDVKPTRLARAKLAIKTISERLKGNNFGLLVFSNIAYNQCPLTYDQHFFDKMVEFSNPNLIQSQGTDLYPALKMALTRLSKRNQLANHSKVIVLVSDGEDFGEEMNEIAKEIRQNNIKVFCLGVGTEIGGSIKIDGELKRDHQRNVVRTKINRGALQKLAKITKGNYFELSNKQNDTNQLITDLSNIKGEINSSNKKEAPKTTFYQYFLYLAVLLLIFDFMYKPTTFKTT